MRKFAYSQQKTLLYSNIDVSELLTSNMQHALLKAIRESVQTRFMSFEHNTCREEDETKTLPFVYCSGEPLATKLEWFESFYKNTITTIVSQTLQRKIKPIENIARAITVQVLGHGMRVECHIDSYPTAANLYLKVAPLGGELAISPNRETRGYQKIINEAANLINLKSLTLGIVHLNNNAHTVSYCWNAIQEQIPLADLPDLNDNFFWEHARIALNFNFDDQLFAAWMPSDEERMSIYQHING